MTFSADYQHKVSPKALQRNADQYDAGALQLLIVYTSELCVEF